MSLEGRQEAGSTDGVLNFYDTQHLSHLITFKSCAINNNTSRRVKICRNETVKPLPPARLLSEQGSRRRSGLVVFLEYVLRPGRVP
jgi:hypothetical protein